jgi:signal transduction histidine kinase
MSAFFVHDLKNMSSTLSLMLQNLPRHFADPAFREDALKAVGKSADRINELVKRLTVLRQTMAIQPCEADLNRVVRDCVSAFGEAPDRTLVVHEAALPSVAIDPEQLGKVVTNLLLNAREATRPGGRIEIETGTEGRWAYVSVRDDGCGMSPEFMSQSLFRPFKSTKKSGMGIGLFHSRTIMDAHGGKLEVSSAEGAGSTFRLLTPLMGGKRGEAPHS